MVVGGRRFKEKEKQSILDLPFISWTIGMS